MGNFNSASKFSGSKVILPDGSVHEFHAPLTVAELMIEYPQRVVVEFNSAASGKKLTQALPADAKLEANKLYLMLPMKRGKPAALSSEQMQRLLLTVNSVMRSRTLIPNWLVRNIFFPQEKAVHVKKENVASEEMTSVAELHPIAPEYLSRQLSGKGWKPSLDTIKEKKKFSHWLSFQEAVCFSGVSPLSPIQDNIGRKC